MTVELTALVWSGVLLFVLILISAFASVRAMGQPWGIGNRDEAVPSAGFAGRAKRAYMNLLEQLVVFAAIAIPAHAAGIHTGLTVLAAQLFLAGRIAHAIVYLAGWTFISIRTLVWLVAIVGTGIYIYAVVTSGTLMLTVAPAVATAPM